MVGLEFVMWITLAPNLHQFSCGRSTNMYH